MCQHEKLIRWIVYTYAICDSRPRFVKEITRFLSVNRIPIRYSVHAGPDKKIYLVWCERTQPQLIEQV